MIIVSSGSIHAEMTACEGRIGTLVVEIKKCKAKIEDQEGALRAFSPKANDFMTETDDKQSKKEKVAGYCDKSVFANRFQTKTAEIMSTAKEQAYFERLDGIAGKLRKETEQHTARLEQLERDLHNEHDRMGQLQIDYRRALAAEEAERRRLAAEANAF